MSNKCPKCGSKYAYIVSKYELTSLELYDLDTVEMVREEPSSEQPKLLRALKTAECKHCGNRFKIDIDF